MQLDKKNSIDLLNCIKIGSILYYTRINNTVVKLKCLSLPTKKKPAYIFANLTDSLISKYEFSQNYTQKLIQNKTITNDKKIYVEGISPSGN